MSNCVDIIIPVFNLAPFIEQAVMSVIDQKTDKIAQIYVCNDASTDNTCGIVRQLQTKYSGLITLSTRKNNVGLTQNMRESFELGKSPFVAFLDRDDYWLSKEKTILGHGFIIGIFACQCQREWCAIL